MELNDKSLAIIKIDQELNKEQARITIANTKYRYVDMTIEFFEEYQKDYGDRPIKKLENIEISQTNLNHVYKGQIFEISFNDAKDHEEFIRFAKKYEVKEAPYSEDKFLSENKDIIKVLNHPENYSNINNETSKLLLESKDECNLQFISTLKPANDFIEKLANHVVAGSLFYEIYDVDGFLSILTNKKDFEFYIDIGDMFKNFACPNKEVFGILVTHYHRDHYNLLFECCVKAKYYVLPYGGSVLYNNKQLYPSDEIRIISKYKNKSVLIFKAEAYKKGKKNKLVKQKLNDLITIYWPLRTSPHDRNLESICISLNNKKVFYPGDTKHYMYKDYIKDYEYFIASHHGGYVGSLNMNYTNIQNIIINTSTKNFASNSYNSNLVEYKKAGKVKEGDKYSGKSFETIAL